MVCLYFRKRILHNEPLNCWIGIQGRRKFGEMDWLWLLLCLKRANGAQKATRSSAAKQKSWQKLLVRSSRLTYKYLPRQKSITSANKSPPSQTYANYFCSREMWYPRIHLYVRILLFISTLVKLLIPDDERDHRKSKAEIIASARAHNLAYPTNTTVLPFGPQLYQAPLLLCFDDLNWTLHGTILPRYFDVRLGSRHSIAAHQEIVKYTWHLDIRSFIYRVHRFPEDYLIW